MFKTKCRPAVDDGKLLTVQGRLQSFAEIKAPSSKCTVADSSMRSAMESSRNQSATCLFTLHIRL